MHVYGARFPYWAFRKGITCMYKELDLLTGHLEKELHACIRS